MITDALTAIYRKVPRIVCKGHCQRSCGPIIVRKIEWDQVAAVQPERAVAPLQDFTCPVLTQTGKCAAYDVRPLICRLWGVVKRMRCPWGCRPKRWLSDTEVRSLLAEVAALDPRLAGPAAELVEKAKPEVQSDLPG